MWSIEAEEYNVIPAEHSNVHTGGGGGGGGEEKKKELKF